jgi:hypothetical protein
LVLFIETVVKRRDKRMGAYKHKRPDTDALIEENVQQITTSEVRSLFIMQALFVVFSGNRSKICLPGVKNKGK